MDLIVTSVVDDVTRYRQGAIGVGQLLSRLKVRIATVRTRIGDAKADALKSQWNALEAIYAVALDDHGGLSSKLEHQEFLRELDVLVNMIKRTAA